MINWLKRLFRPKRKYYFASYVGRNVENQTIWGTIRFSSNAKHFPFQFTIAQIQEEYNLQQEPAIIFFTEISKEVMSNE